MMGGGYAAGAGVTDIAWEQINFNTWNPVLWLVLFVIVLAAVGIVIVTGAGSRGRILDGSGHEEDGRYATFFSGEKAVPSHVSGSDLFWGFKTDWKKYFTVIEEAHSGIVNDYALWAAAGTALIAVFMFIFIR